MKRDLFTSIITHILDTASSYYALGSFVFVVIGELADWKKIGRFFLRAGLPGGFFAYLFVFVSGMNYLQGYLLSSVMNWLCSVAAVFVVWKKDIWRAASIVSIAAILQVSSTTVMATTLQELLMQRVSDLVLAFVIYFASYIVLIAVICWFLNKINFCRLVQYVLEDEKRKRQNAVLALIMELVTEIFFVLYVLQKQMMVVAYNAGMVVLAILLIVILLHISDKEESMRKIQYQESMLLQQQLYVEHLEQMQKEMRAFRHDYKNILSGMYLYAKEGEPEKIQKVLEKLEIDFDQKIGEKIHAATQIGNIQLPEMKSLVLSKLTKMTRNGTACRLEVLYPVSRVTMDIWEFNQCLGILLDNAIEAAARQPEPYIELQLMCHGGYLTVRVANPWEQEIELSEIWKQGYSTKGENRGFGLANYKRILDQYPEAVSATSFEGRMFVQELMIPVRI